MKNSFEPLDQESADDLQAFLTRAKRLDSEGLVRLRAFGTVLAAYVAPIFAGNLMDSGPTVLGLRTSELANSTELDSIVPIASVLDRLAHINDVDTFGSHSFTVVLPESVRAPWAGISPPRTGWQHYGSISEEELTQLAKDGIAEVADSLPGSVGGPIAARIRGEIWGRAINLDSQVPTGAAFVAAGLGFLTEGEEVGIYRTNGWIRLSSLHGHILAKAATHR
jgi:hypothetical protein